MKISKRRPFVLILAGLIIGGGFGLVGSWALLSDWNSNTEHTDALPSTKTPSAGRTETQPILPTDLASVFVQDSATERRLALYQLLEGKKSRQIAELIEESFRFENEKHLATILRVLFSALARLNPEQSLELVWETDRVHWNEFFSTIVQEWASLDPKNAMEISSELTEPWKSKAFRIVFQTLDDFSSDELEELAESYGASAILAELSYSAQLDKVMDDPKLAFELVLQADIPDSRKSEMVSLITERWIARDGTDDLSSMLSLVHEVFTRQRSTRQPSQLRQVVSLLVKTNPRRAWDKLATLPLEAQKMLNDEVFKVWVKQDPSGAIATLNDTDYMSSEGFEPSALYAAWAGEVWDQLPEKINLVPDDYKANVLSIAVRNLSTKLAPVDLLTQLEKIQSNGVSTTRAREQFLLDWGRADPDAALRWANENLEEGEGQFLIPNFVRELAIVDVNKAMEFALQQPVGSRLDQIVVNSLFLQGKLSEALELLPKVRDRASSTNLYASAGELLIETGRIRESIELAEELSDEFRPEYFMSLASRWAYKGFDTFLPVLAELPGEELQSRIAEYILRVDERYRTLTDDETDVVRSFVQVTGD